MTKFNVFIKLPKRFGTDWLEARDNPVVANTKEEAMKFVADKIGNDPLEVELNRTFSGNSLEITCKDFCGGVYTDKFEFKAEEIED